MEVSGASVHQDGTTKKFIFFGFVLQATKLDPYYAPNFVYLGHYYAKFLSDKQ